MPTRATADCSSTSSGAGGGPGPRRPRKTGWTQLREELADATDRLRAANAKVEELSETVERMARVINVLTVENETLRDQPNQSQVVVPLR